MLLMGIIDRAITPAMPKSLCLLASTDITTASIYTDLKRRCLSDGKRLYYYNKDGYYSVPPDDQRVNH